MPRYLEEDYIEPTPSGTPDQVTAAVESEVVRSMLPAYLRNALGNIGTAENAAGPGLGVNAEADEAAYTAAAVAAAQAAGDPYAGMSQQEVDLEKAREKGTFYGSSNVGAPAGASYTKPTTSIPYTPVKDTPKDISGETKDAFALLKSIFHTYDLDELAGSLEELMKNGVGPNEAALLLKTDPKYNGPYLKRFAGKVARSKAGLNQLSEAEYISLENQYSNLLHAYGVKNLATRDEFANLIGSDVSPTEVNKRLDLAVTQVQQADPNIKASLQQYYPQLKDSDLVSYMLNPEKTLPALQEMVTTGQINAAALQQGSSYGIGLDRAKELAALGVDQAAARTGYEKVATVLPTGQKLGQIYNEAAIPYSQTTAEQEFLEGSASAARKRKQLAALEEASFSGRSGIDTQASALGRSIQGKF